MWPRICEAVLALWLIFAPAVFDEPGGIGRAAATLMLIASLLSLADRFRRAHLVTLAVSLAIAAYPLLHPPPASAMLQNLMITGLVIAMFAILPPDAMRPPRGWRELDRR